MPECWLYTIQGEKQLFVVRLSCEPGPACYSLQEQPISPVIYQM